MKSKSRKAQRARKVNGESRCLKRVVSRLRDSWIDHRTWLLNEAAQYAKCRMYDKAADAQSKSEAVLGCLNDLHAEAANNRI